MERKRERSVGRQQSGTHAREPRGRRAGATRPEPVSNGYFPGFERVALPAPELDPAQPGEPRQLGVPRPGRMACSAIGHVGRQALDLDDFLHLRHVIFCICGKERLEQQELSEDAPHAPPDFNSRTIDRSLTHSLTHSLTQSLKSITQSINRFLRGARLPPRGRHCGPDVCAHPLRYGGAVGGNSRMGGG